MGLLIEVQPSAGVALVVGGGTVALRKVRSLAEAGFAVEVVSPAVRPEIASLPGVMVTRRLFAADDVIGRALVFACTGDREVNALAARAARAAGVLVLVADAGDEGTFTSPAVYRDGDFALAVSTGGASPGLAVELRDRAVAALGDGLGAAVEAARGIREEGKRRR
ncbi:MAG: bifunctional precorrin-2 dehydrogenase/sirohydrochlorin ferrochelatase [Dehalococcoidia bacterium]|nr:bifunctional precorrin-2 dehydrogenase/sirohydrochlorin ferrochelatase [Dehalococcoidia bacterium]